MEDVARYHITEAIICSTIRVRGSKIRKSVSIDSGTKELHVGHGFERSKSLSCYPHLLMLDFPSVKDGSSVSRMAVIDEDRANLPTDFPPIMKIGGCGPKIVAIKLVATSFNNLAPRRGKTRENERVCSAPTA